MNERRKTNAEYYDELYSKETPFGMEADPVVRDIPDPISGDALELGAGQGRNSFALAARGLKVHAIEVSPVAVESINKQASERGISVQASLGDISGLEWNQKYDVIVSTFVLHHLTREDSVRIIGEIQEHTNPGGYNALALFTKEGDFFRNDPETVRFYPALGELRELYSDWEVLSYSEVEGRAHQRNEDGSPMKNVFVRILARKIQ